MYSIFFPSWFIFINQIIISVHIWGLGGWSIVHRHSLLNMWPLKVNWNLDSSTWKANMLVDLFISLWAHRTCFLHAGHQALTMSLVLLGKFGVLAATGMMYTYTGELSPTVIRNTAMSSCAMFSRVGSSLSPYLLEMGETFKSSCLWLTAMLFYLIRFLYIYK